MMTGLTGKRLTIGPSHLAWLSHALGLDTLTDRPDLEELLGNVPSLSLEALSEGVEVVREGDPGEDLYMLFKGEAVVVRGGKTVASLSPGDFFGEVSFLVGIPRTATVRAGKDCQVFRMRGSDFNVVLQRNPQVTESIRSTAKARMKKLLGD